MSPLLSPSNGVQLQSRLMECRGMMTLATQEGPTHGSGGVEAHTVIDADGHVFEDVPAIIERLADPYRTVRAQELSNHSRVFPPIGYLSSMPFVVTAGADRQPEETGNDPASWEYFLDEVGIDRTVLYPSLGLTVGRVRDLGYSVALARAYNDWLADTYLRHPSGRFQAAALLPMQVPEAAADELRRAVTELGFCSAVVPSNGLANHPGDARFFAIYAAAEELGVGLSFHGGDGHDGMGFDDFNVFAAAHALGHPFSLLIAFGGMLFNGVFDRFPSLRVAYLEGGAAWILLAVERFSESFGALRPIESEHTLQLPGGTTIRDYILELVRSDRVVLGCEGSEDQLAVAIDYLGCAPFMFSSDFPHEVSAESCRHELEVLDELDLDVETKGLLCGGTARKFYRL
jgi:predicted TIM-barrel fold metal-dependent hydrolase